VILQTTCAPSKSSRCRDDDTRTARQPEKTPAEGGALQPSSAEDKGGSRQITEREVENIEERSSPRTPVIYEIVRRLGEEESAISPACWRSAVTFSTKPGLKWHLRGSRLPGRRNGVAASERRAAQFHVVTLMTYIIAAGGFAHIVAGSVEGFLLGLESSPRVARRCLPTDRLSWIPGSPLCGAPE
jgi:hypothetical protein